MFYVCMRMLEERHRSYWSHTSRHVHLHTHTKLDNITDSELFKLRHFKSKLETCEWISSLFAQSDFIHSNICTESWHQSSIIILKKQVGLKTKMLEWFFNMTMYNVQILGASPLFQATKQHLNGEKLNVGYLSTFGCGVFVPSVFGLI